MLQTVSITWNEVITRTILVALLLVLFPNAGEYLWSNNPVEIWLERQVNDVQSS
jgi:hypothetical protein